MPQCEATTNPCYWWDSEKIEFPQCSCGASVEIDGLNLCATHAGKLALLKLIGSGDAKKIKDTTALCGLNEDRWGKKVKG